MPKGIPGSRGTCSIHGCERPHQARGWCRKHYSHWQYDNLTKPRANGVLVDADERTPFDLSDTEVAWLAGLFEGEGCIGNHGGNSVRLTIKMTDRDVLERVAALTTGTPAPEKRRSFQNKTLWYWTVGWRPDVEELLEVMLPLFGERRRARALKALERLKGQTKPIRARYGA